MPLDARIKALRDALVTFSGKTGVNARTIAMLGEQFTSAVVKRWEHICDVALCEDSGGKVEVTFKTQLDLSGQLPTGKSNLTFAQVVRDDWNFAVAREPNGEVSFEEAIGRRASQFPPAPPQPVVSSEASEPEPITVEHIAREVVRDTTQQVVQRMVEQATAAMGIPTEATPLRYAPFAPTNSAAPEPAIAHQGTINPPPARTEAEELAARITADQEQLAGLGPVNAVNRSLRRTLQQRIRRNTARRSQLLNLTR